MADIIAKLVLQSGEFDSKIKRAVTGLQQMENECRNVGGTLAILEKDQKEYVQSLGRMQTVSTSVRGKISELSNAYTELRAQYNRLSNEEKNGDFGKALSSSLDQLKTRINDSKKELSDINQELGNTKNAGAGVSSFFDELGSKMGVNITQLSKFGGVLAAAGAAVKVLKDAFFQSEANIDEWGRTMKGAEGAYDVFLQTLNNGDWSNFFENLSTAVRGARDLYDSLDRLGSIKANNQAAIAIVQQQIAQLRLLKQQGKNVDDQLKAATERLAQLQGQSVAAGKQAGHQTIEQTIRNGLNSMGGAQVNDKTIRAAIGGILTNGQREFDRYARTVSQYENWSKAQRTTTRRVMDSQGGETTIYSKKFDINLLSAEQQRQYKIAKVITDRETEIQKGIELYANAVQEGTSAAREEFKGNRYALAGSTKKSGSGTKTKTPSEQASELTEEQKIQKQINELVQEGMGMDEKARTAQREKIAALQTQLEGYKKIKDELLGIQKKENEVKPEKPTYTQAFTEGAVSLPSIQAYVSGLQSEIANTDIGSDLFNKLTEKMSDAGRMSEVLKKAMESGVQGADLTSIAQEMNAKLLEGDISDEDWQAFLDKINEKIDNSDLKLKIDVDTKGIVTGADEQKKLAAQTQKAWNLASQSVNNMGSALNAIDDPAAKAAGTVIKAIADIALGFAQASHAADVVGSGWAWLAWLAAGTAAMATTISTVHSLTGFANGGIVPGNSYSGDNVFGGNAMVNSGELVLTKAQQGNLASQLTNSAVQGFGGQPYVEGEKIFLGMNNSSRRMGRGEIVTTQTLRRMGLTR